MPYPRSRYPSPPRGDRMRTSEDGQSMEAPYSQGPRTRMPRTSRPPRYDRTERSERYDRYNRGDRYERPMRERVPRPRYPNYEDNSYSSNSYPTSDSSYNYEAQNAETDANSTDNSSYKPRASARRREFESIPALRRRSSTDDLYASSSEDSSNLSMEQNTSADGDMSENTSSSSSSYGSAPYNSGYSYRTPRESYSRRSDGPPIYGSGSRPPRYSRDSYNPRRRGAPLGSKYSSRPPRRGEGMGPSMKGGKGGPTRALQAQTSAMIAGIHSNTTLTSHALNQMNNGYSYDNSRYKSSDRTSRYNRNSNISNNTIEEDAVILRRFKALMDFGSIPEDQNDLPLLSSDLNPPEDIYGQDDSYNNRYYSDSRSNDANDFESDEENKEDILATNAQPYVNSYIQKSQEDEVESDEPQVDHVPLTVSSDGNTQNAIKITRRSRSRVSSSSDEVDNTANTDTASNTSKSVASEEESKVYSASNQYESKLNSHAYDEDEDEDEEDSFNSIAVDPSAHSAQSVYSQLHNNYGDYAGQAHYKPIDDEDDEEPYQEENFTYNHAAYADEYEDEDDDIGANSINYASSDEQIYPSQYANESYSNYNTQSDLNNRRPYSKKSEMMDDERYDDEMMDGDEYDSYYDKYDPYDYDESEPLDDDDYDYDDREYDPKLASSEDEDDERYHYYKSYDDEDDIDAQSNEELYDDDEEDALNQEANEPSDDDEYNNMSSSDEAQEQYSDSDLNVIAPETLTSASKVAQASVATAETEEVSEEPQVKTVRRRKKVEPESEGALEQATEVATEKPKRTRRKSTTESDTQEVTTKVKRSTRAKTKAITEDNSEEEKPKVRRTRKKKEE